LVINIQV